MKILIQDHTTIAEIQEQFSAAFPFLKLEFFSKQHPIGKPSPPKFQLNPAKKMGDIRTQHAVELDISPDMRVSDLEQLFADYFDLGMQVFRKSGSSWLETILTDSWTLQEQNSEGEFLSTRIRPEIPDPDADID